MRTGMRSATGCKRPQKRKGPRKRGAAIARNAPSMIVQCPVNDRAKPQRDAYLPNARYFSLPTNPNLVTPEVLMICSTLAEIS